MEIKGWIDNNEEDLPYGAWSHPAFNAVIDRFVKGIRPEFEYSQFFSFGDSPFTDSFRFSGFIECDTELILFAKDIGNDACYIFRIKENNILNGDTLVDCTTYEIFNVTWWNDNDPVLGSYKYDINGNLVIQLHNGIAINSGTIYIINFKYDYLLSQTNTLIGFRLNPIIPLYSVKIFEVDGSLLTGTYEFCLQVRNQNGVWSNSFSFTQPVKIYKDETTGMNNISNSAIKLDWVQTANESAEGSEFQEVRLIAIKTSGGIVSAHEVGIYAGSFVIVYEGVHTDTIIDLEEVLTSRAVYTKAYSSTVLNNQLYLGNIVEEDVNIQKFVNNWKLRWKTTTKDVIQLGNSDGENKTTRLAEHCLRQTTLMPGEAYSFYVSLTSKSGTKTKYFPLIGRAPITLAGVLIRNITLVSAETVGNQIKFTVNTLPALTSLSLVSTLTMVINGIELKIVSKTVLGATTELLSEVTHLIYLTQSYPSGSGIPDFFQVGDLMGILNRTGVLNEDSNYGVGALDVPHYGETSNLETAIGQPISYYEISNSAYYGLMGVWLNKDEKYYGARFEEVISPSFTGATELTGKNVRHFKMPSIEELTAENPGISYSDLALEVSLFDVFLPSEYQLEYNKISLHYVKRDLNNQTIITSGILQEIAFDVSSDHSLGYEKKFNDYDNPLFKLRSYEAQVTKIGLQNASWFEPIAFLEGTKVTNIRGFTGDSGVEFSFSFLINSKPYQVKKAEYLLENNTQHLPTNEFREESISLLMNQVTAEDLNSGYVNDQILSLIPLYDPTCGVAYGNLRSLIRNIGLGLNSPTLSFAECGGELRLQTLLAGTDYNYSAVFDNYDVIVSEEFCRIGEAVNSALTVGTVHELSGFQYNPLNTNAYLNVTGSRVVRLYFNAFRFYSQAFNLRTEPAYTGSFYWLGYSSDYLKLKDLKQNVPNNSDTDSGWKPFKIARSIGTTQETDYENFNQFLVNDYISQITNKGMIVRLDTLNKALIVHYNHALYIGEIKDELRTESGSVYLGTGNIFERPLTPILDLKGGYLGVEARLGGKVTPAGYVFVYRGRVWLYNGNQPVLLSNAVFKTVENIFTINELNSYFETIRQPSDLIYENIFGSELDGIMHSIQVNYENKSDRLFITRRNDNQVTTFTYSFIANAWIGLHNYNSELKPHCAFLSLGMNLISVGLPYEGDVYYSPTLFVVDNKEEFYLGSVADYNEFYVDLVFSTEAKQVYVYEVVKFFQEVSKSGVRLRNEGISHIALYNREQCTGYVPITYAGDADELLATGFYKSNAHDSKGWFTFNDFIDKVLNHNQPILDELGIIQETNISNNIVWYMQGKLQSNFIVVRFAYILPQELSVPKIYLIDATVNTYIE